MKPSEQKIVKAVNEHRDMIFEAEKFLWGNPETGYKEWKTSRYLENEMEKMGYSLVRAEDIPGFYTIVDTGRPGPRILILAELDSLLCEDHPDADPVTHAVHSCGHHAQCAALVGIAAALKEKDILQQWCGSIQLCAVPAEELIEIDYREQLRKDGVIRYFGGKPEFLARGYFKDVDMAIMVHTTSGKDKRFAVRKGSNGCVAKKIAYHGVASHAATPFQGVNALYAANLGLSAINALRETFPDQDQVRVHPIITSGGTAVNAIPNIVTLESFVRGTNMEVIKSTNNKVNRALAASAAAIGAKVSISDRAGYAPLINDLTLKEVAVEAMELLVSPEDITCDDSIKSGCTDMGDISAVMPAVHPYAFGAKGMSHGNDYYIENPENACVDSAKMQLFMLHILLKNNGEKAKEVLAKQKPRYPSVEAFLKDLDNLMMDKEAVIYQEDGKVTLDFSL